MHDTPARNGLRRLALSVVALVAMMAATVAAAPSAGAESGPDDRQGVSSAQNSPAPSKPGYPFIQWRGRGDKTLPVLWKVSGTAGVTYDVVYSADGRQSWTRAASGISPTGCTRQQSGGHNHANSVCFTINGPAGSATGVLDNTATYVVAVRSVKSGETSPWVTSDPFEPIETPRVSAYAMACPSSTDYVMFISWAELPEQITHTVRYKIDNGAWVNLPAEDSNTPYHRKIDKQGTGHWVEWMDQLPAQATPYDVTVQVRRTKTLGTDTVQSQWGATTFKAGTTANVRRWLTRCPNTPANLAVTSYTNSTSATVTWDRVAGPHDYDIRHKANTDTEWGDWTTLISPSYTKHTTTHTITGLESAKTYDIAVRARYWDHSAASDWTTLTVTLPELSESSVTTTTATLTLTGHTGDWYVKETSPTEGSCSSAISTTTHDISSLTAGTWYIFKAYSDSSCSTELAAATFSTAVTAGNGSEASNSLAPIGHHGGNFLQAAQAFTTGPNTSGYTLTDITGSFNPVSGSPGNIVVTLHAAASGNEPGTQRATLSGSNPSAQGTHTFTCSTGCSLDASTTYFVAMSAPNALNNGIYSWHTTNSDNETLAPSSNQWSIANVGARKISTNAWSDLASSAAFKITVTALPKPFLSSSSVTATTATLTLTGHTSAWWLKRTTPAGGACTAGESDYSHALTSLTASTSYTYKAYSDSTCSTELHSVSFTTLLGAPIRLAATRTYSATANSDSVALTWTAPASADGRTGYEAQCSTDNGTSWSSCGGTIASTANSHTITGLHNGNAYLIRLRATSATNSSIWVESSSLAALRAPGVPTGISANRGQQTSSWTAPADTGNGQGGITKYEVQCKRGAGSWASNGTTGGTSMGLGHSTCQSWSRHGNYIRVRAFNIIWGNWSNQVRFY